MPIMGCMDGLSPSILCAIDEGLGLHWPQQQRMHGAKGCTTHRVGPCSKWAKWAAGHGTQSWGGHAIEWGLVHVHVFVQGRRFSDMGASHGHSWVHELLRPFLGLNGHFFFQHLLSKISMLAFNECSANALCSRINEF